MPCRPGEIKAPHFDIAHAVDIMPGRQGTFPEVNWNKHALEGGSRLPGDGDANHPTDAEIKFGHRAGIHEENAVDHIKKAARDEDDTRYINHLTDRNVHGYRDSAARHDLPLPGMVNREQFGPRGRR